MKARHLAFCALACLFFLGPILLSVAIGPLGMKLPSWLTTEDASFFDGGVSEAHIQEKLSLEGFTSKELQTQIDNQMGNSIPCKAIAMLTNAQLQRLSIQSSNLLHGWDCYPTFFGSEKIYVPESDALAYTPWKRGEGTNAKLTTFMNGVTELAQNYPNIRFTVYLPGGLHENAINPAYDYVENSFTLDQAREVMENAAQGHENVYVLCDHYDSLEDYYRNFWRTDHHWNPLGSVRAYNNIADTLGLAPFTSLETKQIPIEGFCGRTAPSALYMVTEPAFDLDYDFSNLRMTSYDKQSVFDGNDHSLFWNMNETLRKYEFNAAWLLSQETSKIEGPGTGHAIMISDSFGAGIQRLLALQYQTLDLPWDLFWYESGDERLVDYLNEDTRDVFLVADYSDFAGLLEHFPHYFEH